MAEAFKVKIRKIGTSAGVIIPMERLKENNSNIGDEIQLAIIENKKDLSGFGIAKNAKVEFKRDKKTRI